VDRLRIVFRKIAILLTNGARPPGRYVRPWPFILFNAPRIVVNLDGTARHGDRAFAILLRRTSGNAPAMRIILAAIGYCFVVGLATCHAFQPKATASRPNIVIIMPDDVGYGDFACNGNPIIKTPAIDALAAQSVRFTDFHVSPTCAPTRAALMTGRHEFKNGVTHTIMERERLTLKATTLAQALKSAGYSTGIFGKWHLGDEPDRWPDKRGFDEVFIHGTGGIGQTFPGMTSGDVPGNSYFGPTLLHNGKFVKTEGYCTDVFFGQAEKWIAAVQGRQPFFAYITPNAAHAPLDVPDAYFQKYKDKAPGPVAKFYGMIENIDENVGRLLAQLKASGLEENTLVIFLTDNGTATGDKIFNAGMRGKKGTAYQGGTRVPSFWRWPAGFPGGVDSPALTAHIDIFPTLAELAGIELSDALRRQVEGRSLVPLLRSPQAPWPDRFLVTHVGRWKRGEAEQSKYVGSSIRNSRFTLVENRELYDLATDPGERKNVVADHPEVVRALRAAYDDWWQSVLPMLENETAETSKSSPFAELYRLQSGGK
jgi:arylsulfatase